MFSWKKQARFEVVVDQGGYSSIDGIFEDQRQATERATYLLSLAKYSRVQVVQVAKHTQTVVFERASQGGGGSEVVGIMPIDEASSCTDVLEVYGYASRMTLLRLIRRYADRQVAVPSETLHDWIALRMIEREGMLLNSGITRLAKIQTRGVSCFIPDRERELGALWMRLKQLAQTSDTLAPYAKLLATDGVSALRERIADGCAPAEHDRVMSYAFGRLLEGHREWPKKIHSLLTILEDDDCDPDGVATIDQFLAETIDGSDPIKALIGYSPDLGSALLGLLATLNGKLDDRLPFTPVMMDLSNALARWRLPEVETALLRRVRAGLDGHHPLSRDGSRYCAIAFHRIAASLACFSGFRGGPEMSVALTRRAKTALRSGETDLPFETAVQQLCGTLNTSGGQIGYLLDLAETDMGRQKGVFLFGSLSRIFSHVRHARDLAPAHIPIEDVRRELGGRLRRAGIPRDLADQLMYKIASLPVEETPRAFLR